MGLRGRDRAVAGSGDGPARLDLIEPGEATYPALSGSPRFGNDSNGGYAELAYRPTQVSERWLRNPELVGRYGRLHIPPVVPAGGTESQWTGGVDYWITARTVLKAAYTWDDTEGGPDRNLFAL